LSWLHCTKHTALLRLYFTETRTIVATCGAGCGPSHKEIVLRGAGGGRKTDYRDGCVLDLDASYAIIKDAVEAAGCNASATRSISGPSTCRCTNGCSKSTWCRRPVDPQRQRGVRARCAPCAAPARHDIVAEEFQNPFDFSHIAIRRYKHLGEDIGAKEARRFRDELKAAIQAIAAERRIDSPIYTFLPTLRPPQDRKELDAVARSFMPRSPQRCFAAPAADPDKADDLNTKQLIDQAQHKIAISDFSGARELYEQCRAAPPDDS
jgi:hypothetical protein